MIIIGIDPGSTHTAFGVIKKNQGQLNLIDYGVIDIGKQSEKSPAGRKDNQKLLKIFNGLTKLFKKYKPKIVAVEDIFFFKNRKTAVGVAQTKGIIILAAIREKITVREFTPLQVKQAVASYGRADKNQVKIMVGKILRQKEEIKSAHCADAIACAICCAHSL